MLSELISRAEGSQSGGATGLRSGACDCTKSEPFLPQTELEAARADSPIPGSLRPVAGLGFGK